MTGADELSRWVRAWKEAGPELERIRLREVSEADNRLSLALLAPAFEHALRTQPPRPTSGLIAMQRYLARLRR